MAEQTGNPYNVDNRSNNRKVNNIARQLDNKKKESNVIFTNKQWISVMLFVIVAIIATYFIGVWKREDTTNVDITLHCPDKVFYVQIPKNNYQIDASRPEYELTNVTYKWVVTDRTPMEYRPRVKDKDKAVLKFIKVVSTGEYTLTLNMEAFAPGNIIKTRQCKVAVKFVKLPKFSIDLGTTFSCIGYRESKKITIVQMNEDKHEHCIPSAIYFPKDPNEPIKIGYDALLYQLTDPLNVIFDIKRIVGRRRDEKQVKEFIKTHQFMLTDDEYPNIVIPNRNNMQIRPEQALSAILIHLVEAASKQFDAPYSRDIVISIPAFFHNGPRKGTRSACHLAGLNPQKLVVEPSAAALAFLDEEKSAQFNLVPFLIFDFGGGTLDCSIVSCEGLDCQVKGVSGDPALGGINFDHIIEELIISKLPNDIEITKEELGFIKQAAEKNKKILSKQMNVTDNIMGYEIFILRTEFEKKAQYLVDRAIKVAKDVVKKTVAFNQIDAIDFIVLVGGTSKIPMVQAEIKKHFENKDLKIVHPKRDKQLLVVAGGTIIADQLECYNKQTNCPTIGIADVVPLSLGFKTCIGQPPPPHQTVDLVYVIDATGSMGTWITQVKSDVKKLIDTLKKQFVNITFRVAGVGYRDWGDGAKHFESIDFKDNDEIESFEKWLKDSLTEYGGGDGPEDVLGGLRKATQLSWSDQSVLKLIIHICDAPHHGKLYQESSTYSGDYANGYPSDPGYPNNPSKYYKLVLDKFKEEGISLMIVKLQTYVDTMVKLFKAYAKEIDLPIYDKKLDKMKDLLQLLPASTTFLSAQINNRIKVAVNTDDSKGGSAYSEYSKEYDGKYECDIMDVVIKKNTVYGTTVTRKYCTSHKESEEAHFELMEGDERDARKNYFLANITIKNIPKGLCENNMITAIFRIDHDGIITINATIDKQQHTLTVETHDGILTHKQIKKSQNDMINWFSCEAIQSALKNTFV